jgi:membrane associated rhomboid family serine protease
MFLPIGDDTPRYRMQYVTFALIAVNIAVHIYKATLDDTRELFFLLDYASMGNSYNPVRSVTSGFLHADVIHLLGNMWFLFLFGGSVEGKLGHKWMAAIYSVCLLASDLAQYLLAPKYLLCIGASGAVGGMIGAYWFLFSRAQVEFFYWFAFFWYGTVALSVHFAVIYLFGWDVLMWWLERYYHVGNNVANSAHLGGVVSGVVCGFLLRRFTHVILDGDDMYTRFVVWRLKRKAADAFFEERKAPRPPAPEVKPVVPVWDHSDVPERIPLSMDGPAPAAPSPPAPTQTGDHGVKSLPLD